MRSESIAQKVEPLFSFANVTFVRMASELQCGKDGVHALDRRLDAAAALAVRTTGVVAPGATQGAATVADRWFVIVMNSS